MKTFNCYLQEAYIGKRMSARADQAHQFGQKPLGQWTKAEILERMKEKGASDRFLNKAKSAPLAILKKTVLADMGWHHTGASFRKTTFYDVDDLEDSFNAEFYEEELDKALKAKSSSPEEKEVRATLQRYREFAGRDFSKEVEKYLERLKAQDPKKFQIAKTVYEAEFK